MLLISKICLHTLIIDCSVQILLRFYRHTKHTFLHTTTNTQHLRSSNTRSLWEKTPPQSNNSCHRQRSLKFLTAVNILLSIYRPLSSSTQILLSISTRKRRHLFIQIFTHLSFSLLVPWWMNTLINIFT